MWIDGLRQGLGKGWTDRNRMVDGWMEKSGVYGMDKYE